LMKKMWMRMMNGVKMMLSIIILVLMLILIIM